jgi:competence protein ComEC
MDPTPPPTRSVADLRLPVGGLAAWLTVIATLALPASTGIAVGIVALVGAAVTAASRRAPAATVTLILGCAGAAALATAVRLAAAEDSPLAALARERASVTADLVVLDDPRSLRSGSGPSGVAVAARVEHLAAAGRSWSLSGRVLVLAPAQGWTELLPGQRLRTDGRLAPPRRRDLTVAVLSARSAPRETALPPAAQNAAGRIRSGLQEAAGVLPDGPRGLLPGLALGDTSALDPVLAEDFRTAGLSH